MRGRKLAISWQEDNATLRERYQQEDDAELKPRLQAMWLLSSGYSLRQTAELVAVHYVTLQTWLAWYREGGLLVLLSHKHGGRQGRASRLSGAQIELLKQQAALGAFRTAEDIRQWLISSFDVHYTKASIYCLLHRLQWKPKRTRPQAVNASAETQEAWKKGV